jgi:hypothetical protein
MPEQDEMTWTKFARAPYHEALFDHAELFSCWGLLRRRRRGTGSQLFSIPKLLRFFFFFFCFRLDQWRTEHGFVETPQPTFYNLKIYYLLCCQALDQLLPTWIGRTHSGTRISSLARRNALQPIYAIGLVWHQPLITVPLGRPTLLLQRSLLGRS